jgi:hypothetical protein
VKRSTIKQFIILHEIERVNEVLIYNELNLPAAVWHICPVNSKKLPAIFIFVVNNFERAIWLHFNESGKVRNA